jgi:hypothetical protein
MTTGSGEDETRRIAEDGTQENPHGPVDGGRSSEGPGLSTGGEQEPGGVVPPYEGRKESADPVQEGGSYRQGVRVGGAGGQKSGDQSTPVDPATTPGGRTASPADEEPASQMPGGSSAEQGTDTGSHMAGVPRGEDAAGDEEGRERSGTQGAAERPTGTSTGRDVTGIDPQDPGNTGPERHKG